MKNRKVRNKVGKCIINNSVGGGMKINHSTSKDFVLDKPSYNISIVLNGTGNAYDGAGRVYFKSTVYFEDGTSEIAIDRNTGYGRTRFLRQEAFSCKFTKKVVRVISAVTFSSISDSYWSSCVIYNK